MVRGQEEVDGPGDDKRSPSIRKIDVEGLEGASFIEDIRVSEKNMVPVKKAKGARVELTINGGPSKGEEGVPT